MPRDDRKGVVLLGSFHEKGLAQAKAVRDVLEKYGIDVIHPPSFAPNDPRVDFVRFPGDDPETPDEDIQDAVFELIELRALAVFVLCRGDGYVGKNLAYEIGRLAMTSDVPMYFTELPANFETIWYLAQGRVVSAQGFARLILEDGLTRGPRSAGRFYRDRDFVLDDSPGRAFIRAITREGPDAVKKYRLRTIGRLFCLIFRMLRP